MSLADVARELAVDAARAAVLRPPDWAPEAYRDHDFEPRPVDVERAARRCTCGACREQCGCREAAAVCDSGSGAGMSATGALVGPKPVWHAYT